MNLRSQLRRLAPFTLLVSALALPAPAAAAEVLLYAVEGGADLERLEELEGMMARILEAQGHHLIPPRSAGHPTGSTEMGAAAEATGADYVVTAEVDPLRGQYRLHIHVYYHPNGRLEDLVATVLVAEEEGRLGDILSSMVRRQGLGEDAIRLTEDEAAAREEAARREAEAEARRQAEEEARRREAEEAERRAEEEALRQAEAEAARAAEEEALEEQRSWDARPRYGQDGDWIVQLGVGGGGALLLGSRSPGAPQGGGGILDISARLGRHLAEGIELRAGLDVTTGVTSGLGVMVGATWQGSFFREPVFIGALLELGAFIPFTGSREAAFRARVGPVGSWRPLEHVVLEVSPQIGVLTLGPGALELGASVRAGYRF